MLVLGQGPQSTKKTTPSKLLATGLVKIDVDMVAGLVSGHVTK